MPANGLPTSILVPGWSYALPNQIDPIRSITNLIRLEYQNSFFLNGLPNKTVRHIHTHTTLRHNNITPLLFFHPSNTHGIKHDPLSKPPPLHTNTSQIENSPSHIRAIPVKEIQVHCSPSSDTHKKHKHYPPMKPKPKKGIIHLPTPLLTHTHITQNLKITKRKPSPPSPPPDLSRIYSPPFYRQKGYISLPPLSPPGILLYLAILYII